MSSSDRDLDRAVRVAAFDYLAGLMRRYGEIAPLPWKELTSFSYEGKRVPLLGAAGIWKPAILPEAALSLTTAPERRGRERPYEDDLGGDGLLRYRYQGTDPRRDRDNHYNRSVRAAMHQRAPLIYFYGLEKGLYLATWPVYVVADDPSTLTFTVAIDDAGEAAALASEDEAPAAEVAARRRYATTLATRRLHQASFRARVLRAYQRTCAVCRLRRPEFLEAAHIIPDSRGGQPVVPNGLALCTLHHTAFDRFIIGVRPKDYVVEVRNDVLDEVDGPTLKHGLQELHGKRLLVLPRAAREKPDRQALEARYEEFRSAS